MRVEYLKIEEIKKVMYKMDADKSATSAVEMFSPFTQEIRSNKGMFKKPPPMNRYATKDTKKYYAFHEKTGHETQIVGGRRSR